MTHHQETAGSKLDPEASLGCRISMMVVSACQGAARAEYTGAKAGMRLVEPQGADHRG